MIMLGARYFVATKTSGNLHLYSLDAALYRIAHRPLHGTAEMCPFLNLFSNALRDKLSVGFRLFDFFRLHKYFLRSLGNLGDDLLYFLDPSTLLSNDESRLSRIQSNLNFIAGAFYAEIRYASRIKLFFYLLADSKIFMEPCGIIPVGVPCGAPALYYTNSETNGVNFVTQATPPPLLSSIYYLFLLFYQIYRNMACPFHDTVRAAM